MGWKDWFKGKGAQTLQLGADDIAVFVVGPSGSGKSSFVKQVSESDLVKVGTNLPPCTTDVQAIRCELTENAKKDLGIAMQKSIVFVDTPSFHTGQNERAAEKEMENWLSNSRSKSTHVGVIYMHRVETDPTLESVQKHLDTFARAFPPKFQYLPQRLHAVLSYEGHIGEEMIRQRRATFQTQLGTLRPSGGRIRWVTSLHPDLFKSDDPETAQKAVVALLSRLP